MPLHFSHCKISFPGVPAINGIDLHVQKGEFVFVVGKSGSGKSTLIKLLLKELDPTAGKIYINKKYSIYQRIPVNI